MSLLTCHNTGHTQPLHPKHQFVMSTSIGMRPKVRTYVLFLLFRLMTIRSCMRANVL